MPTPTTPILFSIGRLMRTKRAVLVLAEVEWYDRSRHAILVGQPESNLAAGTGWWLPLVAKAQCEWCEKPLLRDHARGIARRCRLRVRRYVHHNRRDCAVILLGKSEACRIWRDRKLLGQCRLESS